MDVKRREIIGILGAGAAGAVVTRVVEGQTPQTAPPPPSPDAELQAARQGLQRDAQRIAMVNLPQATEPAFRFRA
jgi:hypothetical protein